MNAVCANGYRIVKCMKEYFLYRKNYRGALSSALLTKSLYQKVWDDSPYLLKQLPGIGMVTAKVCRLYWSDSPCFGNRQIPKVSPDYTLFSCVGSAFNGSKIIFLTLRCRSKENRDGHWQKISFWESYKRVTTIITPRSSDEGWGNWGPKAREVQGYGNTD